jgi:hypothetical protein
VSAEQISLMLGAKRDLGSVSAEQISLMLGAKRDLGSVIRGVTSGGEG